VIVDCRGIDETAAPNSSVAAPMISGGRDRPLPEMVAAPTTIAFAIAGPIARSDLRGLCDRVCALLRESRPLVALCDVAGVGPDAVTVDALARLQLAAQRHGCRVHLRNASPELLELVAFMGLKDVLPD
jgi:ABC-type transporter Mla MlaB component